jgi:hypothetical protein
LADQHKTRVDTRSALLYCFVDFLEPLDVAPMVYVIPSFVVAKTIEEAHDKWRNTLGAKGQTRKDGPMRRLLPDYVKTWPEGNNPYPTGWLNEYRDAWGILKLEPTDPEKPLPVS